MLVLLQNGYIWKMYYLKHYRCQNGGWSKIQKVKMVKNLKLIKTRINKVKYESLRRLEVWISTQQVLKPVQYLVQFVNSSRGRRWLRFGCKLQLQLKRQ